MIVVRPAERADVAGIARVRVAGWRTAYRGILEDTVLDGLDADRDTARYLERWDEGPTRTVADDDGVVVGFSTTRRYDREPDDCAEWPGDDTDALVSGLYVAPTHWSAGVGRALMGEALHRLEAGGHRTVRLWVLRDNVRARRFYELAGFVDEEPVGIAKPFRPSGATRAVLEVRYSRTAPRD